MLDEQRKLLTWSLNAGTTAYETDLEKYGHKIYALALHEIQVEKDGICYMRRQAPNIASSDNYGNYIAPATSFNKNTSYWVAMERGMRRWEHIRGYLSFILFGAGRIIPMLDNVGGAQDTLITQIKAVLDHLGTSDYHTSDPNNMQYIRGVEIDFEASMSGQEYADRVGDNVKFMNILKRIKNEVCIPRGLVLQINAYAMWGKDTPFYYRFHDYELFANTADSQGKAVVDELQIMTYDFAWNGSSAGASTPLWWFELVTAWAKSCFNDSALLKIKDVFFGAAAYGHRWGIYDYERMYGSTITYRNFVDWQNGLYKHNHSNGDGTFTWHDQEFLTFASIEDQESKNQVLQQHIYDYFKARHGNIRLIDGSASARISNYNGGEYATTYSRLQKASFTNIVARSFAPSLANERAPTYNLLATTPVTINEDGVDTEMLGIVGRRMSGSIHEPDLVDGAPVCVLKEQGKATYTLDVPIGGSYRLIGLVSFAWYSQNKVAGTFNGSPLVMQASADYYPLMFKASHWFDCGVKTFNTGVNEVVIDGNASSDGGIIYGFIVCSDFKDNFGGGEIDYKSTITPFKKKDETLAALPPRLAITAKVLRQPARPLIMWEDRFTPFLNDPAAAADLTVSAYYTKRQSRTARGNGDTLSADKSYCYDPANPTYTYGQSWGVWEVKQDPYNENPDNVYTTLGAATERGRLIVNHEFSTNVQVEVELRVESQGSAGVQFGGSSGTNGYVYRVNYATRKLTLSVTDEIGEAMIREEPLPANYVVGARIKLRVIVHNGIGYFYLGYGSTRAFGGAQITLNRSSGGYIGLYSNVSDARFYLLSISTTDKWDLMEKFTIEAIVNGTKYSQTFGEINRPNHTIDPKFGYLNYSGLDELSTRSESPPTGGGGEEQQYSEDVSLDYELWITEIPAFTGATDIKVIFNDVGIWFAHLYVVDKEGGSITWVGDSYSFLSTMNYAVNEVGAKGIGMWVMGQEDPRVFETIPDVVPYHK